MSRSTEMTQSAIIAAGILISRYQPSAHNPPRLRRTWVGAGADSAASCSMLEDISTLHSHTGIQDGVGDVDQSICDDEKNGKDKCGSDYQVVITVSHCGDE